MADHQTDHAAIGDIDHLHRGAGQAGVDEGAVNTAGNGLVGAQGLGATAQDRRVAGLQAQAGGVGRHVGAGLINDADHAQGHAHAPHLNAGRPHVQIGDGAHRVGQRGNLAHAFGHGGDALGVERQPIDQRGVEAAVAARVHVGAIGVEDVVLRLFQALGQRKQRGILLAGFGARDLAAGCARGVAQRGELTRQCVI